MLTTTKRINPYYEGQDYASDLTYYGKEFLNGICDESQYISDAIFEFADDAVDIYNVDLEEWARQDADSFRYMGEVLTEGLYDPSDYDLHRHIMTAQFEQIEQTISGEIETILHAWAYVLASNKTDTITQSQADAIDRIDYRNADRFDDISDEVYAIVCSKNADR